MLFTDIVFALFMGCFFCIYWYALRRSLRWQNVWLLSASYLFYGWWDWRFLILILLTSATTFFSAILFERYRRKWLITANIVFNLGILALFKYFNFFTENISRLFSLAGMNLDWFTIDVLLPVGISFYTFQAISYSIDVSRGDIRPTRNIVGFFTFIAFFPQLVAGPIERAGALLPQILHPRRWDYSRAVEGLRMVLFGVMKKVCVADMLAIYVDRIFDGNDAMTPMSVLAGGVLFTLQIYCDFSAYSEIARGVARMLGVELMANFRFPLFSRNILEFWQRWHISLMLWFRDYLYIPLGGNRRGKWRTALNFTIVFLLSGLWHGAAWNFVIWGAFWAVCYVIGKFIIGLRRPAHPSSCSDLPDMALTFGVIAAGFYIFRCTTLTQVWSGVCNGWMFIICFLLLWGILRLLSPLFQRIPTPHPAILAIASIAAIAFLIVAGYWPLLLKFWWFSAAIIVFAIEWTGRRGDYPFADVPRHKLPRLALYWIMAAMILLSEPTDMTFIYFQF